MGASASLQWRGLRALRAAPRRGLDRGYRPGPELRGAAGGGGAPTVQRSHRPAHRPGELRHGLGDRVPAPPQAGRAQDCLRALRPRGTHRARDPGDARVDARPQFPAGARSHQIGPHQSPEETAPVPGAAGHVASDRAHLAAVSIEPPPRLAPSLRCRARISVPARLLARAEAYRAGTWRGVSRPARVLLVEANEDGTAGGSHQCLFDIARSLDPMQFTPVPLFYQNNRFVERLREIGIRTLVWERERMRERPVVG